MTCSTSAPSLGVFGFCICSCVGFSSFPVMLLFLRTPPPLRIFFRTFFCVFNFPSPATGISNEMIHSPAATASLGMLRCGLLTWTSLLFILSIHVSTDMLSSPLCIPGNSRVARSGPHPAEVSASGPPLAPSPTCSIFFFLTLPEETSCCEKKESRSARFP